MAGRVLLNSLPKFPVCTIQELLSASPSEHSKANDFGNRRVIKLSNKREIMVILHPLTGEVFAMDRFCYHHGYPLDTGDMEDIGAIELMETEKEKEQQQETSSKALQNANIRKRGAGPLKFTKEEEFRAAAKELQQHVGSTSSSSSSSEIQKQETTTTTTTTILKRKDIKPGVLEADYDSNISSGSNVSDEDYHFPIITCSLHNRIFDLRTGDMIIRSVTTKEIGEEHIEKKCLFSESTGCHQRIHPVTIEKNENEEDGVIFVHDTFGYSIPMRRPGSKVNMKDRSHLMFLPKKTIVSDKENATKVVVTAENSEETATSVAATSS